MTVLFLGYDCTNVRVVFRGVLYVFQFYMIFILCLLTEFSKNEKDWLYGTPFPIYGLFTGSIGILAHKKEKIFYYQLFQWLAWPLILVIFTLCFIDLVEGSPNCLQHCAPHVRLIELGTFLIPSLLLLSFSVHLTRRIINLHFSGLTILTELTEKNSDRI